MKRMDFVQNGYSGTIFLVTQGEDELQLWDFQAWLKGYYDAYIPFSDIDPLDYKVIGNLQVVFKNPNFNPEYAAPHKYEHSCGYPDSQDICICGKDETDQIHIE